MELGEFMNRLRREHGAIRVELMPDELCDMIIAEEATVSGANGLLSMKSSGLDDFMSKNVHLVVFEDGGLYFP